MSRETPDRQGHPWKAYANGTILCAATRPFHHPINGDGSCECLTIEGETIAEFTIRLR